ncbi:MAG: beta-lactamase family protein [bacterium]|nr:beta-lactamase family protein [bacterium]
MKKFKLKTSYFRLFLAVFILTLNSQLVFSQSRLKTPEIRKLDEIFSHFNNNTPGVAVAVMRDGKIVYERGFGMANLEYDIPIKPNSVFHIASISKEFAAMAVVLLELEGKLSIDDDIRKYIPEVPDFGETITIRHLANHTSGLRDQWDLLSLAGWRANDLKTQGDVLDLVSRQKELNFKPGEEYLYSNTGFTLLAILVDRVSGKSLRKYADEYIFKPLEMNDTHFHNDMGEVVKNRAYAYQGASRGKFRISIPNFETYGATSLFTTVLDLSKWSQNFVHKKVGGEEGIKRLLTKGILNNGEEINYALGITHGTYRELPTIGHGGADSGYRSNLMIFPEQIVSISIFANVGNGNPAGLSRQVADVILGDLLGERPEPRPRERRERPERPKLTAEQLEEYTGTFYSEELDRDYHIKVIRNGKLYLERRKFQPVRMITYDTDVFTWNNRRIAYTRDNSGKIDGFKITSGRVRNLKFVKK